MNQLNSVGRRKEAIARVFLSPGTGKITVNKKDYKAYFPIAFLQYEIEAPLKTVGADTQFDVTVNVSGGGVKGQAEAVRLGISRALVLDNEESKKSLRDKGFLTRNPKVVERKKYGLRKARRATQFCKR